MLNSIKKARLIAGISQGELAKELNLSQGAVSLWEQGKTKPTVGRLKQLAAVLNTTVDKLLEDEERAM